MPRTSLTVQTAKTQFETISAGEADFTFAAGDVANGNDFTASGKDIIIVQNTDGAIAYTVTITSIIDEKNRTGDITSYSLAAGDFAIFTVGLTTSKGWIQTDGKIYIDVENAAVEVAVIKLP